MRINANEYTNKQINNLLRDSKDKNIVIDNCLGQRFIASGMRDINLQINGIPGNALGSYLNGADITVNDNAQDAVGDTMNEGKIIIHGNSGDATGYAMRGGKIYVKGNAGYRAGIHMKEYKDKVPVMIIGGRCGSFLGEYQAGGIIAVLRLGEVNSFGTRQKNVVGNFPCTGMHGGKVFLRDYGENIYFPAQVNVKSASDEDMQSLLPYLKEFCEIFSFDYDKLSKEKYLLVSPNSANPFKQMYVEN